MTHPTTDPPPVARRRAPGTSGGSVTYKPSSSSPPTAPGITHDGPRCGLSASPAPTAVHFPQAVGVGARLKPGGPRAHSCPGDARPPGSPVHPGPCASQATDTAGHSPSLPLAASAGGPAGGAASGRKQPGPGTATPDTGHLAQACPGLGDTADRRPAAGQGGGGEGHTPSPEAGLLRGQRTCLSLLLWPRPCQGANIGR